MYEYHRRKSEQNTLDAHGKTHTATCIESVSIEEIE